MNAVAARGQTVDAIDATVVGPAGERRNGGVALGLILVGERDLNELRDDGLAVCVADAACDDAAARETEVNILDRFARGDVDGPARGSTRYVRHDEGRG